MACQKILQLYGYKSSEDFRQNFNKRMSGGIKQNGTVTNLVWRGNQTNFRINRTTKLPRLRMTWRMKTCLIIE